MTSATAIGTAARNGGGSSEAGRLDNRCSVEASVLLRAPTELPVHRMTSLIQESSSCHFAGETTVAGRLRSGLSAR